ncbi:MAG TPA: PhnD/SsuA/transferrin family substrate-binding protein [Chloroflexota bacterium]|jgi:4,5-dihydroxyphthalate decarboxylase
MHELTLTYAGADYLDRTRALVDGTVRPAGLRLRFLPMQPTALFRRLVQYTEFDVAEMSTSVYMSLLARGDERYVAIPVFLSRNFRHGYIFVSAASGIREPGDLRGKRAGILEYQMTAALWQRALLQHEYGVAPADMQWCDGPLRPPGESEPNPIPAPPGLAIAHLPPDKYLESLLAEGELDALFSAARPPALTDGSGRVRRLFPDFVAAEQDYYRRTGIFPIMHLVVLRRALYQEQPWIAHSLLVAFQEAQRLGWQRLQETGTLAVMLPWLSAELEQVAAVMGPRPWPYGVEENYATISAMCQYHHEQGLSRERLAPEQLFAPETLGVRRAS